PAAACLDAHGNPLTTDQRGYTRPYPSGGACDAGAVEYRPLLQTISSLSPASANAGRSAFTLTVNGQDFAADMIVRWNGADLSTAFGNSTKLPAAVPAANVAAVGTADIPVYSPTSGLSSTVTTYTIANGGPTVTTLSPAAGAVGGPALTL